MKELNIISTYNGGIKFLETRNNVELTIFVIDDQEFYASMLKQKLEENPKYSVYTFHTGEAALDYLELMPDLIVLDYHLDGIFTYAKKGDEIAEIIKAKCPTTQVLLMSADHKLTFLDELNSDENKILFKDRYTEEFIKSKTHEIAAQKKDTYFFSKLMAFGAFATFAYLAYLVIS